MCNALNSPESVIKSSYWKEDSSTPTGIIMDEDEKIVDNHDIIYNDALFPGRNDLNILLIK